MSLGRLDPQYYQASGEATPQAEMPEQFRSNPVPPSPLSGHLTVGYMGSWDIRRAPVVSRVERTVGMRHLYVRGSEVMPVHNLGADGPAYPWNSGFQKQDISPIHNGHFNDALFQAGYPGFNLGLSFKVPTLLGQQSGRTTRPQVQAPVAMGLSQRLFNRLKGGENPRG